MIDCTNKINSIPEETLRRYGKTREGMLKEMQKENAALIMCGGLLGTNYIIAETIDWILAAAGTDLHNRIKNEKWFRHSIKHNINTSIKELKLAISCSRNNSITSAEYMMDMADAMYDEIKLDLLKLSNGIILELGKAGIKDGRTLADVITVGILFTIINDRYNSVIKYMKTIYNAFYDSWYFNAKFEKSRIAWHRAINEFSKLYVNKDIDINKSSIILNGTTIISNKFESQEITEKLKAKLDLDDRSEDAYDNSLNILGLKKVNKNTEKSKDKTEETSIEDNSEDFTSILASKYKVIHTN